MIAKNKMARRQQGHGGKQDISQALLEAAQQRSIQGLEAVLLPHGGWLTRFQGLHVGTWVALHTYPYTEDPGFKEEKRKNLENKAKFTKAVMEMTQRYGKLKTFELFDAAIAMAGLSRTRGIDISGGRWLTRELVREAKRYTLVQYLDQVSERNLPPESLGRLGITLICAASELSQCLPEYHRRRDAQESDAWRMILAGVGMMGEAGLGDISAMEKLAPGILPVLTPPNDCFWEALPPGEAQQNLVLLLMVEAMATANFSSNPAKHQLYTRLFEQGLRWLQAQPQLIPWDEAALMAYRGGAAGLDMRARQQLQSILLERLMLAKTPQAITPARKQIRL